MTTAPGRILGRTFRSAGSNDGDRGLKVRDEMTASSSKSSSTVSTAPCRKRTVPGAARRQHRVQLVLESVDPLLEPLLQQRDAAIQRLQTEQLANPLARGSRQERFGCTCGHPG